MSASPSPISRPAITVAHPDRSALRIVLFGMPDAGKSSLLGALAQVTQSQDRELRGRLLDLTHGLSELWRRVYENRPRETLDEIVPYPVFFERYVPSLNGRQRIPLLLFDCDGRVANEILSQRRALQRDPNAGPLAQAVLDADALILVVDASANDAQLQQDYREFSRFLTIIQNYRSYDRAVGGLPVHLALTKCDLLAREQISLHEWEVLIDRRKNQVIDQFSDFLRLEGVDGFNFGSVDLHIAATAVRRPALSDALAQPREPYGVAELFHECFEHAELFRERVQRADRRLKYTVFGAAGLLGALAVGAFLLLGLGSPADRSPRLLDRVELYQRSEGALPNRLAASVLELHRKELLAIRQDPTFHDLPPSQQQFVRDRLDEIQAYQSFRELLAKVLAQADRRSLETLLELQSKLETEAAVPKSFVDAWEKPGQMPEAVAERKKRLEQIQVVIAAIGDLKRFYQRCDDEGKDLIYAAKLDKTWENNLADLLERAKTPGFSKSDPERGEAFAIREVVAVQKDWREREESLTRLRDFASALGILGTPIGPRAPLAAIEAGEDADINMLAAKRFQNLRTHYPLFATWSLSEIKEKLHPRFREKLIESRDALILDGQQLILRRLRQINPMGPESVADWLKIADWLQSPAVQEWRELTRYVARLLDPEDDPIGTTVAFLRKKSFTLEIRSLKVRIPDGLRDTRLTPAAQFTLLHQGKANSPVKEEVLKLHGQPVRDGATALVYEYRATGTQPLTITYEPGDGFSAVLDLQEDKKSFRLTWVRCRSAIYQTERLMREPRLHLAEKPSSSGELARGVTVTVDGTYEAVPGLIPSVLFEKK